MAIWQKFVECWYTGQRQRQRNNIHHHFTMFCLFLCDISLFQPWQGTCLQLTPLLSTRWSHHHHEEDNFDANPRNGLLVHYHNDIYFDGDGDARWYWWGWWMTSTTLFECLEHPLRCFAWVKSMRCTVWPKSKKDRNLFPASFLPLCPANTLNINPLNATEYHPISYD